MNYTLSKDIISKLNSSYIFLQGGPGAGKTFHTANTIVELLK